MGTSGSSKGSGSNTSLVPTWLDGDIGPIPGTGQPAGPSGGQGATGPAGGGNPPAISAPSTPERFRSARSGFTRFAKSGGRDTRPLRQAIGRYVRSGAGGSANATRRMGAARSTASGVLGIFRDIRANGVDATLQRLNLAQYIGRSPEEVFAGLVDVICRDGGPIDEGMARDAWLETVAELETIGIHDLAVATDDQISETFLRFIAHSIENKLLQEIGARGFKVAADNAAIEAFQDQLRAYILGGVRDSFSSDLSAISSMTDMAINSVVDKTFRDTWDLLVVWGDQAQ